MKFGNIDEDGNALMADEWWLMTRNSNPVTVGTHVKLVSPIQWLWEGASGCKHAARRVRYTTDAVTASRPFERNQSFQKLEHFTLGTFC
jgi:hypothetical protein